MDNRIRKFPLFRIIRYFYHITKICVINLGVKRRKLLGKLDKKSDRGKIMVNLGGGLYTRRHWKVLDFYSEAYKELKGKLDYIFDLTTDKKLPFEDNTVSFFYSSHVLEHLPEKSCQHVLKEMYRCLKMGGGVRLTMPDFDKAYNAFAKQKVNYFHINAGKNIYEKFINVFASPLIGKISYDDFKDDFNLLSKENFANKYTREALKFKHEFNHHINWWNYKKLKTGLKQAGFKIIYRSLPQKSKFTEMRGKGRYNGFDSLYPEHSLFVEAIK